MTVTVVTQPRCSRGALDLQLRDCGFISGGSDAKFSAKLPTPGCLCLLCDIVCYCSESQVMEKTWYIVHKTERKLAASSEAVRRGRALHVYLLTCVNLLLNCFSSSLCSSVR